MKNGELDSRSSAKNSDHNYRALTMSQFIKLELTIAATVGVRSGSLSHMLPLSV
jgi:hypothetical protein